MNVSGWVNDQESFILEVDLNHGLSEMLLMTERAARSWYALTVFSRVMFYFQQNDVKGTVHPNMKILSLTRAALVPDLYEFSVKHERWYW